LRIPYNHLYRYLNMAGSSTVWNTLGTFGLSVMSPLRVGPSAISTSVTLSVFCRFENASFQVINPLFNSSFFSTVVAQGGIQSSVKNYNFTNAAISGTVDAKSGNDDFKGGSTDITAADKPNWAINPIPMQPRPFPTVANACNVEFAEVLELDPAAMARTRETGFGEDEMNLRDLHTRFSYYGTFQVANTNILGDAVFVADLCPCDEVISLAVGTKFTPSLLTYSTLPFSYWRGSLRYKFVAVSSSSHSLRLQICSHVGFSASGLSVNQAFGQYTCVFDVTGISEVIVEFPWRSPTDWKKVLNGSFPDLTNYSMGQFSVRILNQLQAPEVVATAIDVLVYIAGGSDYETAFLGNNAVDFLPFNE